MSTNGPTNSYDVAIVGGGHNGLIAAAYLAKAGRKVVVLERRHVLGGCAVTEEVWPGYKVSVCSFVTSMFSPRVAKDLDLQYDYFVRDPATFTPFRDGRSLTFWVSEEKTCEDIRKISEADAKAFPEYVGWMSKMAMIMEPIFYDPPPNLPIKSFGDMLHAAKLGWRNRNAANVMPELLELLTGAASDVLDHWFEFDGLKTIMATEGLIGSFMGPRSPGTAALLMHLVMGETAGRKGVWACPKGGMGALSMSIAKSAQDKGVEIRTNAPVEKVLVKDGQALGVVMKNGDEIKAKTVLSGIDPYNTFMRLVGNEYLPDDFAKRIRKLDFSSASVKINLALGDLPRFTVKGNADPATLPEMRGSIHICNSVHEVEQAFDEAKYGRTSTRPVLHCTIPSLIDDTLAPKGKHVMNMMAAYAPYNLMEGNWDDVKEAFADRCIDMLAEHAPNIKSIVEHRQILGPKDFESTFGLHGGNIFHGAMTPSQMFSMRPAPGWAQYRTPIRRLYLCGAGGHPGGGVTGIPGRNAARQVLKDGA